MNVDTIDLIAGGLSTAVAAFVSAFVYRLGASKQWGKASKAPTPTPAPAQDFEDDTGLHMLQLVHVSDQQVQARVQGEILQRIYRWTLTESQARALDQLGRETQAQTAEAVQAIAIALDRDRSTNSQRDMRLTAIANTVNDLAHRQSRTEEHLLLIMEILRRIQENQRDARKED